MNTIEEKFARHRQSLDQMKAPEGLEERLRQALDAAPKPKSKKRSLRTWSLSAAAALLLLVSAYQYPAFAYYGDKLLNGAQLSKLSFDEIAEYGYGQTVNKVKMLPDGTAITVSGVIADENGLSLYYTVDLPGDTVFQPDESTKYGVNRLKGFMTNSSMTSGSGNYNEDWTQFHGVYRFQPVSPFSRTLTAYFGQRLDNGKEETIPISFKFEANKAMKSIISQKIDQSVKVDEGVVHYDAITATPTSTKITGQYEMDNGETPRFPGDTKLMVNGHEVLSLGSRSTGSGFELEYEVLPTDHIEAVDIVLNTFEGYQKVEEPISLKSPSDRSFKIGSEKLWIRSVSRTANGYDIVIARNQFTFLDRQNMSVQAGGQAVPIESVSVSRPWDLGNGNVFWEQTYSVRTTEKPAYLQLKGFKYIKSYGQKISILPLSN